MKNYLFLIALFSTVGFAQIIVPQTTKSFYGIVEATWCGVCGQYGIPSTNNIIAQTDPKAIYVSLHKSSTSLLYSQTAAGLVDAFGVSGQPIYTVNANDFGPHTGSVVDEVVTAIDDFYTTSAAAVNAGFEYGIVGDSLYVHTKTTFFQDLTGEYYVGIYIYEDSIWEWQVNYDPGIADMDIWHNHVLRTSLNGYFGEVVTTGNTTAGTSFTKNAKLALDPSWNQNQLHVFTIVWKKNGTTFEFVNANDSGTMISGQVGVEETAGCVMTLYPNPTTRLLYIAGLQTDVETHILIFDLNGNVVVQVLNESVLDLHYLANGQYIVEVKQNGKSYRQKIFKNQ